MALAVAYYFFGSAAWPRRAVQAIATPVAAFVSKVGQTLRSTETRLSGLWQAERENRELKADKRRLEGELIRLREENRSCENHEAERQKIDPAFDTTAAKVIAYDPVTHYRSLSIDRGTEDGVQADQAVLANGALVGRVLRAEPRHSQILLVTDLQSAVDVLDARSRARGTLVGLRQELSLNRERWLTRAEYVSAAEEIQPGDLLLTSGMDGVFPKGLPVGVVSRVEKDSSGLFWNAEVEPHAELSKLEEVWVITGKANSVKREE